MVTFSQVVGQKSNIGHGLSSSGWAWQEALGVPWECSYLNLSMIDLLKVVEKLGAEEGNELNSLLII